MKKSFLFSSISVSEDWTELPGSDNADRLKKFNEEQKTAGTNAKGETFTKQNIPFLIHDHGKAFEGRLIN